MHDLHVRPVVLCFHHRLHDVQCGGLVVEHRALDANEAGCRSEAVVRKPWSAPMLTVSSVESTTLAAADTVTDGFENLLS